MFSVLTDLIYVLALVLIAPARLYRMIRHGRYRQGWAERLGRAPKRHGLQPVIWLHAVSYGEVEGIRTLVDELTSQLPDYELVISSTTDTGIARARALFAPARKVFFFPMDFSWAVARAFRRLRPDMIVLMEGEFWPNLLRRANRRKVPVVLVNGRMSQDKGYPRYKLIKPLAGRMFNKLAALGVQDPVYAERFIELGTEPEKVHFTGTLKFDTAIITDRIDGADAMAAALGLDGSPLIVAGGTGPGEEKQLLDMFATMMREGEAPRETRLAIAPRKPERFDEVAGLIDKAGYEVIRRSARPDGAVQPAPASGVILLDVMGELLKLYSLATAVFAGRSLARMGGSNMLEAAALGKPTAFGPHTYNFPQARSLVQAGAARQVRDADELSTVLSSWLNEPDKAAQIGRKAQQFIRDGQGATRRNVEMICKVLGRAPAVRAGSIATRQLPA